MIWVIYKLSKGKREYGSKLCTYIYKKKKKVLKQKLFRNFLFYLKIYILVYIRGYKRYKLHNIVYLGHFWLINIHMLILYYNVWICTVVNNGNIRCQKLK